MLILVGLISHLYEIQTKLLLFWDTIFPKERSISPIQFLAIVLPILAVLNLVKVACIFLKQNLDWEMFILQKQVLEREMFYF